MLGKTTLKRMTVGMIAAAASVALTPLAAHAQTVTCVWYNSLYDYCEVTDWNPATMQEEVTDVYFKLREVDPHIDP